MPKELNSEGDVRDDIAAKLTQYQVSENAGSGKSPTKEIKKVGTDEVLIRTVKGDKYVAKVRKLPD
jgi:hypothetical protein